jgi:hypothetical protein
LANLGSESETCVGSRIRLVGVSISFEKNFYRLPFTRPLSGSPYRSLNHHRHLRVWRRSLDVFQACRCAGLGRGFLNAHRLPSLGPQLLWFRSFPKRHERQCFVDVHPLPAGLGRCRYVSVQPMLMSYRIVVGYEC